MRIWFERVTKKDARALVEWWNGNVVTARFFVRKRSEDKFYNVVREDSTS